MKILVIEDDARVIEVLKLYLEAENFEVEAVGTGEQGLQRFDEIAPDLVVLDILLPGLDGWTVARALRHRGEVPLILLTSRTDESDRVLGFEIGADDYVPKPFSPRELVGRIKAVLRRTHAGALSDSQQVLHYRGLSIDPTSRTVERDSHPVELTRREFDLLWHLASSPGRVHTRDALYEQVWEDEPYGDLHTLEVHINRLRAKLETEPGRRYLVTVRGVGYKFEVTERA
jgi:two-component system response regulator ResD